MYMYTGIYMYICIYSVHVHVYVQSIIHCTCTVRTNEANEGHGLQCRVYYYVLVYNYVNNSYTATYTIYNNYYYIL